ncbi:hypothetical protein EDD85DRAFT_789070 [Armillaria nabsnona]|nr:hypothetical protein EDD85DRAFT_789070 [Armillaria nabsnona]
MSIKTVLLMTLWGLFHQPQTVIISTPKKSSSDIQSMGSQPIMSSGITIAALPTALFQSYYGFGMLSAVGHTSLATILDGETMEATYTNTASEDDSADALLATVTVILEPPAPPPSPILEMPLEDTVCCSIKACTQGYSSAMVMMRKHQHKAIKIFNWALAQHNVSIIAPSVPCFLFSPLVFCDMQMDEAV